MLTRMSMLVQYPPPPSAKGGSSISSGAKPHILSLSHPITPHCIQFDYHTLFKAHLHVTHDTAEFALTMFFYGLGAFISGFLLTTRMGQSVDGRIYPLRMNFPTPMHWRWRHQILLTFCMSCLAAAHALVRSANGDDKNYIAGITISIFDSKTSSVFVAWMLTVFASGFLNAFTVTGSLITLRAGNVTGTVQDMFLALGFSLRSRSLRYVWRMRLLLCCFTGFYVGGIFGSLVFRSSFGASALLFPIFVLAPLWLIGAAMLSVRYSNPALYTNQKRVRNLGKTYVDVARGGLAQLHHK